MKVIMLKGVNSLSGDACSIVGPFASDSDVYGWLKDNGFEFLDKENMGLAFMKRTGKGLYVWTKDRIGTRGAFPIFLGEIKEQLDPQETKITDDPDNVSW